MFVKVSKVKNCFMLHASATLSLTSVGMFFMMLYMSLYVVDMKLSTVTHTLLFLRTVQYSRYISLFETVERNIALR